MKSKPAITLFLIMLVTGSFFLLSTGSMTNSDDSQNLSAPQRVHTASSDLNLTPPSILVYTQFVDGRMGEEYENTMLAIDNTYGTNYQHTNLTDYTNLNSQLPGKDILLIPEQENANTTIMKTVGLAWAATLTNFVTSGGVVVLLDFGNVSAPGMGLHIYNASGLMHIGAVINQYPGGSMGLLHRHTFGDALCRRIEYQPAPRNNTIAVDTTDGTVALDIYQYPGDLNDPIAVHKRMGQGHVVFLGFDLSELDANYEQILGNAIRLPNNIVIDTSQNQEFDFEFPAQNYQAAAWVEDMLDAGFAVSRMDPASGFNPVLFNTSDVLICTIPYWTDVYSPSEIAAIDEYVANGGSVFLFSDWGSFGDEIRALVNNFGYDWARDSLWDTDDAMRTYQPSQIAYEGDNILSHPITTNVTRVEFYASDGFTTLPANAEKLIVTDRDGTSSWSGPGYAAEGVATMAVSRYGSGRVCVVLDSNFVDGTANTDSSAPNDYYDSNNSLILMNTIRWLAGAGAANEAPLISGLTHTPASPVNGDPLTVHVNVADTDGLDSITCHYRVNAGTWQNVTMTPEGGDLYSANIGNYYDTDTKEYYIQAFDSSIDMIESVSAIIYLNAINHFPSTPSLSDPGTSDDDGVFLLNWTSASDPDGYIARYEIEMSDTSGFTTIVDRWNSSIDEKVINVFNNDTYYFRVRSVDDYGTKGFWSNSQWINVVIVVDVVGPSITNQLLSPALPKHGESVTVTATVTDPRGIKNVTCYYNVNSGSWQSNSMVKGVGDQYSCDIGFFLVDDSIEYYITAFDNSSNFNLATTTISSFEILNQPPTAPILINPGTTIAVSHLIVNWTSGYDLEGAIDHYQLQMSASGDFTLILTQWNVTATDRELTGLSNGIYYLRVRTVDDHGAESAWSNVESIEVLVELPTTTTSTTATTTSTTTSGTVSVFDPNILNLVFLIVTGGFVIILVLVVYNYFRQKSQSRYTF
jgi:hypothetical protein